MAELTQKERLQPSLLDRLTDNAPREHQESREQRVLSWRKLREGVLRDLTWLLNCTHLAATEDLSVYPAVTRSVLNYGVLDLAGKTISGVNVADIEGKLRQAIIDFEPRILRHTVKVSVWLAPDQMSPHAMSFLIEGELWAQPLPLRLYIKTDIDLETGNVAVQETSEVVGV